MKKNVALTLTPVLIALLEIGRPHV